MDKDLYNELIDSIKKLTFELQTSNKLLINDKPVIENDTMYYVTRYIQEFLEASVGLIVVMIIMKKSFTCIEFVKIAGIVGLMTLILEEYNKHIAGNFKQGVYSAIGSMTYRGLV